MSEVKYENLYTTERYEECRDELKIVLNEVCSGHDITKLITASRLDAVATNIHPHRLTLILEGNIVFINNLKLLSCVNIEEKLNNSLLDYYTKIRALYSSESTFLLSLYLNSLHNALWFMWMKGIHHDIDRDKVFEMLEHCFRKVLMVCQVPAVHSSVDCKNEVVLELLCQVANNVVHLETVQSLQVVEVSTLCLHLFLYFKIPMSKKYKSVAYVLQDSMRQIEAKCKSHTGNVNKKSKTRSLTLFKFGYLKMNESTVYDIQNLNECLHLTLCLWIYGLGCVNECSDFIESCNLSGTCSKFLSTYLQAYISQQLQQHHLTQLYIAKLSCLEMSEIGRAQFHILKGQYNCSIGNGVNAHYEFKKLLSTKHSVFTGLYLVIDNLSARVRNILYNRGSNYGCSAIIGKFIQTLLNFHKFITSTYFTRDENMHTLDEKFFCILHKGKRHEREDVIYTIGREILWIEVLNLSHDNSYNLSDVAADCYFDVLSICYQSESSLKTLHHYYWIALHEAIIAFILCGKTDAATVVSRVLVETSITRESLIMEQGIDREEKFLMENGITTLMLVAYVKICNRQLEDANGFLTRVKKTLVQLYFSTKHQCSNTVPCLLDAVTAKMYLLKASLQVKAGYKDDALWNCQKSLVHNPGDDNVQECLKIAQKIGVEINIPQLKTSFPVQQCKSLTLYFLLTAKVSL